MITSSFAPMMREQDALIIKEEADHCLIREITEDVGLVNHNFRQGVMDKLKLGGEAFFRNQLVVNDLFEAQQHSLMGLSCQKNICKIKRLGF
jgi:hypothetical protein